MKFDAYSINVAYVVVEISTNNLCLFTHMHKPELPSCINSYLKQIESGIE